MTFSQRKDSSGSKRLISYIQKIGSSNETLVLKDNMEIDSHSSSDTNKSDEDNLLSMAAMGALLPSEETSYHLSNSFHKPSSVNRKERPISAITNGSSLKKYSKDHKKSISIDIQNIKRNISDYSVNNNGYRSPYSATPNIIHSAPSNPVSQISLANSASISSNNYKHRSFTNGYSFNGYQNYSPHSPLYNIPSYSVTPSTTYHASAALSNSNSNTNAMSSSLSTVSYNHTNSNNTHSNSVFSNSTLNNHSSSGTSANSLTNRFIHEPLDLDNNNIKRSEEEDEDTPLNIVTSINDNSEDHNSITRHSYRGIVENEEEEILDSTDMYSSKKQKSNRKQKSFYKRLLNQNGEHHHQICIDEDYLDIKREDTQIIHDIFQKSINNNFTLSFKDTYTEICYARYINNKYINLWKKSIILLALVILLTQFIIIFSCGIDNHVYKIIIMDALGLALPVIIFYYLIYRLKSQSLTKVIPYLINFVLFFMGPVGILGANYIVNNKNYTDTFLLAYISFFFIGHYILFSGFIPSIISVTVYCICWIISLVMTYSKESTVQSTVPLKSIIFIIVSFVIVYSLYKKERTTRRQFLNEQRLMRINSKLVSQLNRIERDYANEAADLDAPIEKAIITIRSLMASPTIGPEHLKALGMVLCYLQVPNLFAPDLDKQVTQGLKMDDERKKWLFNEVAHSKQISKRNSSSESSSGAGSFSPFYTQSPSIHDPQSDYQIINIDNFLTNHSAELLTKINDYNFQIFEYFKSTSRPLLTMSYHIFVKSGLLSRLHLSVNQFLNFMSSVEDGYHPEHQFHNAEHASDVLHCIYYFSTIPNVATCFKDLDYLGMFMAACIHDYDHPGVSNKFLINVGDPLAELYNDKSVLENHHCSAALKLLNKPGNNFIDRLDKEKKRELRETIIELVLATDLSNHFSYLTSFKKKLLDTLTCNSREDRLLLMQMLIKCCDVSNPTKGRNLYKGWIDRVMSEFFSQGDKEKSLNVTVSPFCNRENANVYSCQKGFIDFVAAPIFEAVGEYISKFEVKRNSVLQRNSIQQGLLQITSNGNSNNNNNNALSRENSVNITSNNNNNSMTSHNSATDNDKQNVNISSTTNDDNTKQKYHHKKTYSKFILEDSKEKINVIINGLKSNKDWIDNNAAKTESS